ncbi:DUF3298 domain-containing protein [Butyrivibrio sp. INlla21]|uniref:DUF3298 domain-containing protein n=1 Tax=Butyrivibrio sp. INlla21 TaxID=1520811 RepID=UPI0008E7CED2|nr:DUF3298 domain-containing protein [Butyrivibrio sp. INlla21]SFU81267.1 Protein of unknown function [Butyrivibrio sp. INlla21]
MIKKLIFITCTAILALFFVGCGKEIGPNYENDNVADNSSNDESSSLNVSSLEMTESTEDAKDGFLNDYDYLLTYSGYGDEDGVYPKLYLVDKNGDKKEDLTDRLINLLMENNINVEGMIRPDYYASDIGVLFTELYFDGKPQGLFAIDIRNNRIQKVFSQYEFGTYFIDCMEYYDNKLYVLFYDKDDIKIEKEFSISDGFVFDLEESDNYEVLQSIDDYYVEKSSYHFSDLYSRKVFSLKRAFDEIGYVVVTGYDNGVQRYFKIEPDGKKEELNLLHDKKGNVIYYDKEKIIFAAEAFRSAEYATDVYSLDFKNNKLDKILDVSSKNIFDVDNNKLYYTDQYSLHEFDLEDRTDKLVYSYEEKAGVSLPYNEYYQFKNGNIFVSDIKDAELKWFRIDGYSDDAQLIDIDCPIKTINSLKYGSVEHKSFEGNCPFCGVNVWRGDYELFSLNKEYSKQASKINKALSDKMEEFVDNSKPYAEDETECDYHNDDGYYGYEEEFRVSDVRILNDKFLAVEMPEFSYGGGPHGTYYTDEYIFDLETGEELSMENFYPGTEDEFKTLIAGKILEDRNINPDHYAVDEENGEEKLYNEAYERASIDSSNISYYDDHATYCFNVYELGSYASGEYKVDIPYEELNGNSKLTRNK